MALPDYLNPFVLPVEAIVFFDLLDHTDESRQAVERVFDTVRTELTADRTEA